MERDSTYPLFDNSRIKTYPLKRRSNRNDIKGFIDCKAVRNSEITYESSEMEELAGIIAECHNKKKPVILISGAHSIKGGLAPLFIDLIDKGIVTLYATNGATPIHSFEFALTGASSERVEEVLKHGEFGMAFETGAYLNQALIEGNRRAYGYGEAMGRLIEDDEFRKEVIDEVFKKYPDTGEYLKPYDGFKYGHSNIFGRAFKRGTPATVHALIGADIIDQHSCFDPAAKGATSGRDFLIFAEEISKCTEGGVVLNVGSAVTGPEVLLKAVAMAANIGAVPDKLYTANFNIMPLLFDQDKEDESQYAYYLRDQKSITTRIPRAFGGKGFYFEGDHAVTVPALYQYIMKALE